MKTFGLVLILQALVLTHGLPATDQDCESDYLSAESIPYEVVGIENQPSDSKPVAEEPASDCVETTTTQQPITKECVVEMEEVKTYTCPPKESRTEHICEGLASQCHHSKHEHDVIKQSTVSAPTTQQPQQQPAQNTTQAPQQPAYIMQQPVYVAPQPIYVAQPPVQQPTYVAPQAYQQPAYAYQPQPNEAYYGQPAAQPTYYQPVYMPEYSQQQYQQNPYYSPQSVYYAQQSYAPQQPTQQYTYIPAGQS